MEAALRDLIAAGLKECFGIEASFVVEHPKELAHGDYASNVAMVVAKRLEAKPQGVAEAIAEYLRSHGGELIAKVSVVAPGFINIMLPRDFFAQEVAAMSKEIRYQQGLWSGKKVMVEYTDPNPFKPFHIGHLMTNAIGESIARLLHASGAIVIRANYQGDVGLHVAKALYGIMEKGRPPESYTDTEAANYIGICYAYGSEQYEQNESAKNAIGLLNKSVYERTDSQVNELYDWGRRVTLSAFEELYKTLGTKFDYYFFESEMAAKGLALVREFLQKGVFEESDGAIVFKAERYNPKLHTRVFITREGLPTYETKELGLTITKFEKAPLDTSIVITATEQKDYMAVATEAVAQIVPEYAKRMIHITHGMMRFTEGKMSSRKGNVITGASLLETAQALAQEKMAAREMLDQARERAATQVGVAAVKYAILRQATGGDIVYDPEQSVSFEGDSGPYLQYTATRAASVIAKAVALGINPNTETYPQEIYDIERTLYRFPSVIARAALELEPHYVATYLIDLASRFNSFYAKEQIATINDANAPYKVALSSAVHRVLTEGLDLLGIAVPEKM